MPSSLVQEICAYSFLGFISHTHMQLQSKAARQQLIDALDENKCILVIAAYPLPANLNSASAVLAAALAKVGNTPLATLNLDPLLTSLKSEDEGDDHLVDVDVMGSSGRASINLPSGPSTPDLIEIGSMATLNCSL
jgi:hypothetical protein